MKSVLIHRMAIVMSAVLLLAGVVAYVYLYHFRNVPTPTVSSLYTLVPADAIAVVETNDVAALVQVLDQADENQPNYQLPVSEIFNCLRDYVQVYLRTAPHGLSAQLSKMLLSYHSPGDTLNQVLYCNIDSDDAELLRQFLDTYLKNPAIEPQVLRYQGEDIYIYQLNDGHILAAYTTDNYLAVSFRKELLEKVIEAQQQSKTLSEDPEFMDLQEGKSAFVSTAVYFRSEDNFQTPWNVIQMN